MSTTVEELREKSAELREFFDQHMPYARPTPVLADFVKVQHELMWGTLWLIPGLDLKLRSYATISAQICNGYDFGVEHQTRVGLTIGITPQQIRGIIIQLLYYIGVPATVSAMRIANDVINEREEWSSQDTPLDTDWLNKIEDMLNRGREIRIKNWGEEANAEVEESLAQQMVPEASDIVDGYHFGEVWARPDLGPKERMVCILMALMCRGQMKQFKKNVGYALNVGLNKREICEALSQGGWYRGWPCVEEALEYAKEVFDERGI